MVSTFPHCEHTCIPLLTGDPRRPLGVTGLTALTGVFDVSETAPILATMLGLAVGIDYALFILSRHRQNLGDGLEPARGGRAGRRHRRLAPSSSPALTVVIALVGLTVVNIPFLTVMGLAAAGDGRRSPCSSRSRCCPRSSASPGPRRPASNRVPATARARQRTPREPTGTAGRASSPRARCRRCSSASPSSAPSRCPRCT